MRPGKLRESSQSRRHHQKFELSKPQCIDVLGLGLPFSTPTTFYPPAEAADAEP